MTGDGFRDVLPDPDPEQTLEWQEAIRAVSDALGPERAHRLLLQTIGAAREEGLEIDVVNTPYLNTIHPSIQPAYPGDIEMEKRIHGIITWNAMMMVTRANKSNDGIGGFGLPTRMLRLRVGSLSPVMTCVMPVIEFLMSGWK